MTDIKENIEDAPAGSLQFRETYRGERLNEAWLLYGGPDYEFDTIARYVVRIDRATLLGQKLPADVVRLVIAARIVAFENQGSEALKELDAATESFAARVPWDNEPGAERRGRHNG